MNYTSNLSSLNAHNILLGNSASNITNVNNNNPQYNRIETKIQEAGLGTVQAETRMSNQTSIQTVGENYQTDMSNKHNFLQDTMDQKLSSMAFKLNVQSLKTLDEVEQTTLNLVDNNLEK
jgi:hypothetical protein